ncbi:MAG: DUF3488 domain-containing protein [Planctomycetota bacterium]|nr:MAG: DUF3488 domain-containing protein [Planctomycetota bacterium]
MSRLPLKDLVGIVIAMQIMVATCVLGLGEGSFVLPATTLFLLVFTMYFTDRTGRVRLKQRMADMLAMGIVLYTCVAALRSDRQALLIVVANLQCYLQYVLLFQEKKPRIYWQLALLSLGQVAIASTLVPGPIFGVMLLIYLLLGIVSFALLLQASESDRAKKAVGPLDAARPAGGPILVGDTAAVESGTILRGLFAAASAMCAVTIVMGGLLFLALPRWSAGRLETTTVEPLQTVGYSKTVTLGELGAVVNNPDVVMRVTFYRGRSNRPLRLAAEPLFRGNVVTRYEGHTWSQPVTTRSSGLPTDAGSTITRQRIRVEALDVGEICCVAPVVAIDYPDPRLRVENGTDQLYRLDEYRDQPIDIDIGTTGISGDRQRMFLPADRVSGGRQRALLQPFSTGPNQRFSGLTALAAQILAEQNIDPARDRLAAARALSDYFHESGEFFYTLDPMQRDAALDPLEDFVTRNRAGHCEYFAGALALMLRSQGIPARVVIGFKGGEWNSVGQYYQVQQLHAHSWVEAYLGQSQIPDGAFGGERIPRAAWATLDPTEGTLDLDPTAGGNALWARTRQFIDYARVLWINYVASLTAKRQREGIYEPLAAGLEAGIDNLTSVQVWQDRLRRFDRSFAGRFWHWYRRHWFSWRGGLVAITFSLFAVSAFFGIKTALEMFLHRGRWGAKKGADAAPVLEMYRRLEAALERAGLSRPAAQTAYEFALAAGGELAERIEHRRLAHLPRRVVESFYRVRFGNRPLDTQEAQAVENALTELERSLAGKR